MIQQIASNEVINNYNKFNISRESLLFNQQQYFKEVCQPENFQKINRSSSQGLKVIIDSTNQPLNLSHSLDLKFANNIPNKIEDNIQILIVNETIETDQFSEIDILQYECIPSFNLSYQHLWNNQLNRGQQIFDYLLQNLHLERDVLIYCEDINELEIFQQLFSKLANVKIKYTKQFNELYSQVDQRSINNNRNQTIFLLLEPQYLESQSITLIIHTQYYYTINLFKKNCIHQQKSLLSIQDLIIREIPKSNNLGVKILYNFTKDEYLQLPKKSQNQQNHQDLLEWDVGKMERSFYIIKSVLNTQGIIQKINKLDYLKIRTSHIWSNKGDSYSWLEIIEFIGGQINSIILNSQIDKNQSIFEYNQLLNWCADNNIYLLKCLLVLLKLSEYAKEKECQQIDILHNGQLVTCKRSSSFQLIQDDKPQVEELLIQNFPNGQLQTDKCYRIDNNSYQLDDQNIQKQKGRLQINILVLGMRDNNIIYVHNQNRKQSVVQKEIVFSNIGNAIMKELWKDQGIEIEKLENQLNCLIEPNPELNIVSVLSDEDTDLTLLKNLIDSIKVNLKTQILQFKHESQKKLILSQGGIISEYIQANEYKQFKIFNLPQNIQEKDIYDLFEDFTVITHLQLNHLENETQAYIVIEDKDDMPYIINAYDESEVGDRIIKIKTEKSENEVDRLKQPKHVLKAIWYSKICTGTCTVLFKKSEYAKHYCQVLDQQLFDEKQIKVQQIDENTIKFSNLSQNTSEFELLRLCGGKQKVQFLDIQSKIISEPKDDYSQKVLSIVKQNLEKQEAKDIISQSHIIRKMGGKRIVKFQISKIHTIQKILEQQNGQKFSLGTNQIKVWFQPIYKQCHIVDYASQNNIKKILENNEIKYKIFFDDLRTFNKLDEQPTQIMTLQTYDVEINQKLDQIITTYLQGQELILNNGGDFLFTNIGQAKLKELEINYQVLFIVDKNNNKIRVRCDQSKYEQITKLVNDITNQNVQHNINLPPGAIKELLGSSGQGLEGIKNQFNLAQIKYIQQKRELQLIGIGQNINNALNCIEVQLSQMYQEEQEGQNKDNSNTCLICFDTIRRSYLLQSCSHRFCQECLSLHCQSALQDIKNFPIKCPLCNEKLILNDIIELIGQANLKQLVDIALNKFVQDNAGSLSFCFTPNCINFETITDKTNYQCTVCEKSYCIQCKALYHPGLTCEENKIGDTILLQKFMKEQDVRKCPNCQALIQRIDGCYRVTCSLCKKSICWKNDQKGNPCMQVFATASECYQHLTDKHNGYW